nr:hypothetical protein [Tanacetum cinerariifolium]
MMVKRIGELEHTLADLIQVNKTMEERKGLCLKLQKSTKFRQYLHKIRSHKEKPDQEASFYQYTLEQLDIPQQVSIAVSEVATDAVDWAMQAPLRNRFRDLPEADMKEILHLRIASGSQVTPPPPPPTSTNQDSPSTGSAAPSPAKTAATTKHQAWSTLDTGDITSFMEWFCKRRGITELKPQDLEGPAYEIVRYGSKGCRPALSISKMKVAYYLDARLKQMVPDQFWIEEECKYDIAAMYGISHWWFQRQRFYIDRHTSEGDRSTIRTHMRILSVVRIEVFSMYGYDYMKKVVLRHLNHLPPKYKKILTTAVNQWTRQLVIRQRVEDFQLGIESYQTQMIMRFNEIHKFSDGTLQQIVEALDYRVKEFRINMMNPEAFEDTKNLPQPGELCWRTHQRGRLHTFEAYRLIKLL